MKFVNKRRELGKTVEIIVQRSAKEVYQPAEKMGQEGIIRSV